MCIAFAEGHVMLHTWEGNPLAEIAQLESPATSLAICSGGTHVAMACRDGHLSVNQLTFATVHGLFRDCYAFRYTSSNVGPN
jgi:intraflagellar transport protein 122